MPIAEVIVTAAQAWLWIGAVVALVFLTIGMDRIDADARGAYVFRPLLVPGILLIWPLVLWRWWQIEAQSSPWAARYRAVRASYGLAVIAMSLGIIAIVALGLTARQSWPAGIAPIQLSDGTNE
ncbi:MAG: hypothetical protein AAF601_02240 [Pseudomonadota bacterium]